MNKTDFKGYVCRPYCIFFREGEKEEMACHGARILEALVRETRVDPRQIRFAKDPELWPKHRAVLEAFICSHCPFRAEDCDFQSDEPEDDLEPCGGYIVLSLLLENRVIDEDTLKAVT
jgi:hypothetical protein